MSTAVRFWLAALLSMLSVSAFGQPVSVTPEFADGFDNRCRRPGLTPTDAVVQKVHWFRCKNTDTAIVFVHGFNSNNRAAWFHERGAYWPTIVTSDRDLDNASVVLVPFYSAFTSGPYGLSEASRGLWDSLTTKNTDIGRAVLDHQQVLFVAHSTGGVLLRRALAEYQGETILKGKRIGLLLVASPSEGSDILTNITPLVDGSVGISNRMLQQLQPESEFLSDLLIRFRELVLKDVPQRGWTLVGRELAETQPVGCSVLVYNWFLCTIRDLTVVSVKSATAHFPRPVPVPERNHMSLAKPEDADDKVHETLRSLYNEHMAGRERSALVPIPFFYSVAPIPAPTRFAAAFDIADLELADMPAWRLAVFDDKCLSSDRGSVPQAECGKKFDLTSVTKAGLVTDKLVFCNVATMGQASVCTDVAPPISAKLPQYVDVVWKGGAQLYAAWDGASQSAIKLNSVVTDSAPVYEVRVAAARPSARPVPAVPPTPRFHRYREPSAWIETVRQASPPTMRISVFPANTFDVAPGREDDRVRTWLRVETDPQYPGKVRYLPQ